MKIKELREKSKSNPIDLAKLLDISIQSYYRYESGQNEPSITKLIQLADFYGVSLDYLCDHKTKYQADLGYLTPIQQNLINLVFKLNENNAINAVGYLNGLLENQNKID